MTQIATFIIDRLSGLATRTVSRLLVISKRTRVRVKYRQYVHTYPDGTKGSVDILEPVPNKLAPVKSLERAVSEPT